MSIFDFARSRFFDENGNALPRATRVRYAGMNAVHDPATGEVVITVTPGAGSSGTSVTITNPSNGELTSALLDAAVSVVLDGSSGGIVTITGIRAVSTGGQLVKELTNNRLYDVVIAHQDAGATAANRVITPTGTAWVLRPGTSVTLGRDTTAARYRVQAADALYAESSRYAGSLDGLTTMQLDTLVPDRDGVRVHTVAHTHTTGSYGYGNTGDHGGRAWRWILGDTTPRNGISVMGTTAAGRWHTERAQEFTWPQVGAFAGQNCGAIVSAAIAALRVGFAGTAFGATTLRMPNADLPFLLESPVVIDGGNTCAVRLLGDGTSETVGGACGSSGWRSGSTTAPTGSVAWTAPGVDGIVLSATGYRPRVHLEGFVIVGTGAGTSCGVSTRLAVDPYITTGPGFRVGNFWCGFDMRGSITNPLLVCPTAQGCTIGHMYGGPPSGGNQGGTIDTLVLAVRAEQCNVGLWLRGAWTVHFSGGLLQGNRAHVLIGDTGQSTRSVSMRDMHWEGYGNVPGGLYLSPDCAIATTTVEGSAALSGIQTLQGVSGADGLRVWVGGQADKTQNGIYAMHSGAWTRVSDATPVQRGTIAKILGGTYANTFRTYAPEITLGVGLAGAVQLTDTLYEPMQIEWVPSGTAYNLLLDNIDFVTPGTMHNGSSFVSQGIIRPYGSGSIVNCRLSGFVYDMQHSPKYSLLGCSSPNDVVNDSSAGGSVFWADDSNRRVMGSHPDAAIPASGSTYTPDAKNGSSAYLRMENDFSVARPVNLPPGGQMSIMVHDVGSARTVGFPWYTGYTAASLGAAPAGQVRTFVFQRDGWSTGVALISDSGWKPLA